MVLRRGDVYYTNFVFGGSRVRKSTGTGDRELAEQAEARLKRALWSQRALGERPERSWKEAVLEYAQHHRAKRTLSQDLDRLDKMTPVLERIPLHLITNAHVNAAITAYERAAHGANARNWKTNRGLSAASRNRYRAAARHLLNLAADHWNWIERAPKIHLEHEPKEEARWLTPPEAEALLNDCTGIRAHWRGPVALGLSTGLRAGNIFGLRRLWVDLTRRVILIPARAAKGKRTIAVPLNDYAVEVLKLHLDAKNEFVFLHRGAPMERICPSRFRERCRKLGIEGATFHSLRHTWAAWHIMAGTPMYELMVMGGWTSLAMLQRTYGHLSTQHLAQSAQRIVGTNLVTAATDAVECAPVSG